MPPKVTYWTGSWDPAKEGISKEINALRVNARSTAPVVSFAPAQRLAWKRTEHVLMLPARAWPLLRGVAALLEARGDITHIFGGNHSWHLLRALGRRPILLTAVLPGTDASHLPLSRISRVAVEAEEAAADWERLGIPRARIVVMPPGIDLESFTVLPPPSAGPFTLLFASTPPDPVEIAARGLPLLVALARLRPDIDIIIPWRLWGNVDASRRALDALSPTSNFRVTFGNVADMRSCYAAAHATVVCFDRGVGKVCPNFVIEGLACGRPCLATDGSGVAEELRRADAGLVVHPMAAALAAAVDRLRADWPTFAANARRLAEQRFDLREFRARYDALYLTMLAEQREP